MYKLIIDSTEFDIDDEIIDIDIGLPKGVYKMNDVMSDGGIVSGSGFLEGRIIELSKTFIRVNETARQKILEWFTTPNYQDVYLQKSTTDGFTGQTLVRPALGGGEGYNLKEFIFSDAVPLELYAADPYFTSTTVTSTTVALTSSTEKTSTVTLSGAKNFCTFALSSGSAFTLFQVKNDEDFGFRLSYSIPANSTIEVFTSGSELVTKLDNSIISGGLAANSSPFELNSSQNTLFITGNSGTVTITYYERRL
jgi:hypothetical protein